MIAFIADFFNIVGGAEKNDSVLLENLRKKFSIEEIQSHECGISDLEKYDFVIVGNFVNLQEHVREYISKNKKYLIYEHDHKYVVNRDPSKFSQFKIPEQYLVNVDFYKNAKSVICLSEIQVKILKESVGVTNAVSIGTSLWSKSTLDFIRSACNTSKDKRAAIMDSSNPIKNKEKSVDFCKKQGIEYSLISSSNYQDFLTELSRHEMLVFFPGVLESLSRLVVEAKMMNCKIVTTPKLLGAYYEDWFGMSGESLIKKIEEKIDSAFLLFEEVISR